MAQGGTIGAKKLLVIGGSAGSLDGILYLLPALQKKQNLAVILVLHRRSGESRLVELLTDKTDWRVKEAEEKEPVDAGTIYVAPADYHLLLERNKTFSLDDSEKVHYSRPSIDVTFESAADSFGDAVIALLLSGANADGTEGLMKVKGSGGLVWIQDPAEAAVSYMPQYAVDRMVADAVLPVAKLAALIRKLDG